MTQALHEEKRKLRLNNEKSKSSKEHNSDGKVVSVESVESTESSGSSENQGGGKGRRKKENCRKNSEGRSRGQGHGKSRLNKERNADGGLTSGSSEVTGQRLGLMMRQKAKQKRKSVASKSMENSS